MIQKKYPSSIPSPPEEVNTPQFAAGQTDRAANEYHALTFTEGIMYGAGVGGAFFVFFLSGFTGTGDSDRFFTLFVRGRGTGLPEGG